MRELIYRRTDAGYRIDRCAPDLPKAMQSAGSGYAMAGMSAGVDGLMIYYRQFRLPDGALAVGASYRDPFGDRKSLMADVLFTRDRAETAALLDRYPTATRYFQKKKQSYSQSGSSAETWAELDMPVSDFVGSHAGDLSACCRMLRGIFVAQPLLQAMFEALLDVASNNPRMIVLFGPDERDEDMAEHGRSIIEALFACLPVSVAARIGYIAPADTDEANALFGIRYSCRRPIADAVKGYAYAFDLVSHDCKAPAQAGRGASEYAAALASLVFSGDQASVEKIRELRRRLDCPELNDCADVPGIAGRFFRVLEGASALPPQDADALLRWRHDAVADMERGARNLDALPMWDAVERWAEDGAAMAIRGDDRGAAFGASRLEEAFQDGERLYRAGRGEADAWRGLYEEYLRGVTVDSGAGQAVVHAFSERVKSLERGGQVLPELYATPRENWVLDHWQRGELYGSRACVDAVKRLYALDPDAAGAYLEAEIRASAESRRLREGALSTHFDEAVFDGLAARDPEAAEAAMRAALTGRDPFADDGARAVFGRYMKLSEDHPALLHALHGICAERLSTVTRGLDAKDVPDMIAELTEGGSFMRECAALGVAEEGRRQLEARLRDVAGQKGVYPYYPDAPDTARALAELLGAPWPERLRALEQANGIKLDRLTGDDIDRLLREGWCDADDRELPGRVRALLWARMKQVFDGAAPSEALLTALALHNCNRRTIDVAGMRRDAEALGVNARKLQSFCKGQADRQAVRGLPYIAQLALEEEDGTAAPYPRPVRKSPDWEDGGLDAPGLFAGIPAALPLVAAPVCGAGFVACCLGVLRAIGLL